MRTKPVIEIKIATKQHEFNDVYRLTHRAYNVMGYCLPEIPTLLQHYPHLDNIVETTVIIAEENDTVIGTVSITMDSVYGLHVDEDFPKDMLEIRKNLNGKRLGASWRIVTDPYCPRTRKMALDLMKAGFEVSLENNIDVLMCSFNPKHESFYQRFLGFETVAYGMCKSVGNKSAVLMRYELARNGMPKRLEKIKTGLIS